MLLDNIIYYQTSPRMSAQMARNNYSPYSKPNTSETQQLPLRNRAYSHLDNISHHSSQYDTSANDDKVSGIKRKYEKVINLPARNKGNEENSRQGFDFAKSSSIYQPYEEPSQYRKASLLPTRKPSNYQPDFSKHSQGKSSSSYGRVQIKSQLQSNRMTLNAMRNQLQAKLSQLNSKTKTSSNTAYRPFQEKHAQSTYEEPADSYEAILSKYSKNTGHSSNKYNDDANKNDAFNDTATINSKQRQRYTSKTDHKPTLSLNQDKYSNYALREKPEEVSRSFLKNSQYDNNYAKISQQQRINLQFTLQKKEPKVNRKENTYLSKYFADNNKGEPQSHYRDYKYQTPTIDIESSRNSAIYYPQQSNFKRSEIDQLRDRYDFIPTTKSTQMPSNPPPKSPAKQQPRDNQAITKQIQRLDMKIRQIEQNKKQLNINFKPFEASSLGQRPNKPRSNYPNYQ